MSDRGILPKRLKEFFDANIRELSSVEGNILSVTQGKRVKSFFITSCHRSEGKTLSAMMIAYALATQTVAKVLLIDGNLVAPRLHKLFGVDSHPGFVDLLLTDMPCSVALRQTEFQNLHIMPSGTDEAQNLDMFNLEAIKSRISELSQSFDYVIFDGQPVFGSSSTLLIAEYFNGLFFVIQCEKTRWEVLQQAKEKVTLAGGRILGAVLNKRKLYIPEGIYRRV